MPLQPIPNKSPSYSGSILIFMDKMYRFAYKAGGDPDTAIFILEFPCGRCVEDTLRKLESDSGIPVVREWRSLMGNSCSSTTPVYFLNTDGRRRLRGLFSNNRGLFDVAALP